MEVVHNQQLSCPVWERPEVISKVKAVKHQIYLTLAQKNLYKWRVFVEELQQDIELEIYKYEQLWLEGKYINKATGKLRERPGVGAYLNMAMQGAMNYVNYWLAQKRCHRKKDPITGKDWINPETGRFEADPTMQELSLDRAATTAQGDVMDEPLPIGNDDPEMRLSELMLSIQQEFGTEIHILAQKVLAGETLSKKELEKIRTPEFKKLLTL